MRADEDKYLTYRDIPNTLIREFSVNAGLYLEDYLLDLKKQYEERFKGKDISVNAKYSLEQKLLQEQIEAQKARVLKYDLNEDGKVEKSEVYSTLQTEAQKQLNSSIERAGSDHRLVKAYQRRYKNHIEEGIADIFWMDSDEDEAITYQEMVILDASAKKSILRNKEYFLISEFLWLDPSKETPFLLDDLMKLGKKFFKTLDLNDDGLISTSEHNKFYRALNEESGNTAENYHPGNIFINSRCKLNEDFLIPDNATIYAVEATDGLNQGPNADKHQVIHIKVDKNLGDIALLLFSYMSTSWHFDVGEGTQIHAVASIGFYSQTYSGLDEFVNIFDSNFFVDEKCGGINRTKFSYDLRALNPLSRQLFNKPIKYSFRNENYRTIFVSESGQVSNFEERISNTKSVLHPKDKFNHEHKIIYGSEDINANPDLNIDALRFATKEEAENWYNAALEKEQKRDYRTLEIPRIQIDNILNWDMRIKNDQNAYVVMKDFRCNMLEGFQAAFIVPEGVKKENYTNCKDYFFFYMDTLTCKVPVLYELEGYCERWK